MQYTTETAWPRGSLKISSLFRDKIKHYSDLRNDEGIFSSGGSQPQISESTGKEKKYHDHYASILRGLFFSLYF